MPNPKKPPRLKQSKYGTYIVAYWRGRSLEHSLGTKDLQKAENLFAGWLKEYKKDKHTLKYENPPLPKIHKK